MNYQVVVCILIAIVVLLIVVLTKLFFGKKENDIPNAIVGAGITLVLSGIPSVGELIAFIVAEMFAVGLPETGNTYVYMGVGFLLIVLGLRTKIKIRERIHVLNMLGLQKKEISNESTMKKLNIADYKLREHIIDIMHVFQNGRSIDNRANDYIVNQIKDECTKFAQKSKETGGCFTGMAPIPYTIYAGTFLGEANVNRYFEFNRNSGEMYYELKNSKIKKKKWPALTDNNPMGSKDIEEMVLAISITNKIMSEDLKQFEGKEIVELSLSLPKDNIISSYDQLLDYKNVVHEWLEHKTKELYPKIKRIHIVASIPSCMSLELGKTIGMGQNRVPEIVVYHYINSEAKRYPFGIVVSGNKKGDFVSTK